MTFHQRLSNVKRSTTPSFLIKVISDSPVSSSTSRLAAASILSPGSTPPFGRTNPRMSPSRVKATKVSSPDTRTTTPPLAMRSGVPSGR